MNAAGGGIQPLLSKYSRVRNWLCTAMGLGGGSLAMTRNRRSLGVACPSVFPRLAAKDNDPMNAAGGGIGKRTVVEVLKCVKISDLIGAPISLTGLGGLIQWPVYLPDVCHRIDNQTHLRGANPRPAAKTARLVRGISWNCCIPQLAGSMR
jgi:hypothetical protein